MSSFHYALFWLRERSYEKRFQSETSPQFNANHSKPPGDGVEYQPVSYSGLKRALDHLPSDAFKGSFVDYGCGKGRALLIAALFPFQKVIGIEYDSELAQTAQSNISNAQGTLQCHTVEVIQIDATLYDIPNEASVFFFYQPFVGETLSKVLRRLQAHIINHKKRTTIITYYPVVDSDPLLKLPYLYCTREFRPYHNASLIFRIYSSTSE